MPRLLGRALVPDGSTPYERASRRLGCTQRGAQPRRLAGDRQGSASPACCRLLQSTVCGSCMSGGMCTGCFHLALHACQPWQALLDGHFMGRAGTQERQRGSRTSLNSPHLVPSSFRSALTTQAALAVAGGSERGALVSEHTKSRVLMSGTEKAQPVLSAACQALRAPGLLPVGRSGHRQQQFLRSPCPAVTFHPPKGPRHPRAAERDLLELLTPAVACAGGLHLRPAELAGRRLGRETRPDAI